MQEPTWQLIDAFLKEGQQPPVEADVPKETQPLEKAILKLCGHVELQTNLRIDPDTIRFIGAIRNMATAQASGKFKQYWLTFNYLLQSMSRDFPHFCVNVNDPSNNMSTLCTLVFDNSYALLHVK
jgi:hypothetical protein